MKRFLLTVRLTNGTDIEADCDTIIECYTRVSLLSGYAKTFTITNNRPMYQIGEAIYKLTVKHIGVNQCQR